MTDIRVGNLKSSYGNHIKASDSFMAFNVDAGGRPLSIHNPFISKLGKWAMCNMQLQYHVIGRNNYLASTDQKTGST